LLRGALDALKRHGVSEKQIEIVRVPGAFDIPIVARKLALSRRYEALIALGAVIRGQTPHFDYVAGECAGGIARIALETGVPVAFGVLTTDTVEQAVDRAGGKAETRGRCRPGCHRNGQSPASAGPLKGGGKRTTVGSRKTQSRQASSGQDRPG